MPLARIAEVAGIRLAELLVILTAGPADEDHLRHLAKILQVRPAWFLTGGGIPPWAETSHLDDVRDLPGFWTWLLHHHDLEWKDLAATLKCPEAYLEALMAAWLHLRQTRFLGRWKAAEWSGNLELSFQEEMVFFNCLRPVLRRARENDADTDRFGHGLGIVRSHGELQVILRSLLNNLPDPDGQPMPENYLQRREMLVHVLEALGQVRRSDDTRPKT